MGDFDDPYLTLEPAYEAAQLGVFATMFEQGHIYRGLKPVWYSPSSRTALAEAELERVSGVDVDVTMNPKMSDVERDFALTSRSRVEMSAGQRISPNDANLSEIGGVKDTF